jgi:hypothetical protein
MRILIVVATAGAFMGCTAEPQTLRLLQANVGNSLLSCQDGYAFKLCEKATEDAVRDQIASLAPDVIALQEVLPSCDGVVEDDPTYVCHADHASNELQIERILPDGYAFACDDRNGYECVAVKEEVASLSSSYVVGDPVGSDDDEDCDPGFTVGEITVSPRDAMSFTLVNGHPQSGFIGACRRKQLQQVFTEFIGGPTVLSGDWNLDPFSGVDPSVDYWVQNVGEEKPFAYHSGIAERNPPFPTTDNVLQTAVLDHVASNFASGTCMTLGEAEGTERLCPGESCDHRALLCALDIQTSFGTE